MRYSRLWGDNCEPHQNKTKKCRVCAPKPTFDRRSASLLPPGLTEVVKTTTQLRQSRSCNGARCTCEAKANSHPSNTWFMMCVPLNALRKVPRSIDLTPRAMVLPRPTVGPCRVVALMLPVTLSKNVQYLKPLLLLGETHCWMEAVPGPQHPPGIHPFSSLPRRCELARAGKRETS